MKRYAVLPLRLGAGTATSLSGEHRRFYLAAAQSLVGGESECVAGTDQLTIPIDNRTINSSPQHVYSLFFSAIAAVPDSVDLLVVDLTIDSFRIPRGSLLIHLSTAVAVYLQSPSRQNLKVAVLLPELPPDGDDCFQPLQPLLSNGRVLFIAADGSTTPVQPDTKHVPASYRDALKGLGDSPLEILNRKCIRRLGHFKRIVNGTHVSCSRAFYDASGCVTEVVALVRSHVAEQFRTEMPGLFLYETTAADWLEQAVLAVASGYDLPWKSLDSVQDSELAHSPKSVLIVVAAIDTGESISIVIRRVRRRWPSARLEIVSVLSSASTDPVSRTRRLTVDGVIYAATYFRFFQREVVDPARCRLCELQVPPSSEYEDDYVMLTAHDMWDMSDEAGWRTERDVPAYRSEVTLVPDYARLVDLNGAWISSKFCKLLELQPAGIPPNPVVVCPDESGAVALTAFLGLVLDLTIVRVPRNVINEALGAEALQKELNDYDETGAIWLRQLRGAATRDVVVVDEFNYSGNTRRALERIVNSCGRRVYAYCCLVDFSMEQSADVLALYRVPMVAEDSSRERLHQTS